MVDYIILAAYLAGILAFGLWCGRGVKTLQDYSVAGRSYGAGVIFCTLAASFIGGGFSVGNAGKVFVLGIASIVALWGFSLMQFVIAAKIAPRMDGFRDVLSVGDIMARNFGNTGKVLTGIFSFLVCAGIVGAQVGAMGKMFEVFIGFPPLWGALVGCGIVIAYAATGGMKAVVLTDIVQFVLLAVGIPLTLFLGIEAVGGWTSLVEKIPATHWEIPAAGTGWMALISLFLIFVLGETLVPPYVQRLFIGHDARAVRKGTLWAALFSVPFFAVSGAIGLVALALQPDLDSNLAMPHVVNAVLPPVLKGLVVAAVIAIVMSSADSFLNAASVAVVNDVVRPLARKPLSDKTLLLLAQVTTVAVGVLAIWFALSIQSVLDILIYAYNFWAPIILVPLFAVLMGSSAGLAALLCAAAAGLAVSIGWDTWLGKPWEIEGLVVGVAANAVVFFTVAALQRPVPRTAAGA